MSADQTTWEAEAFKLGAEAAHTAASWTSTEHPARILAMLDAGDPAADDYLPARPDLSGEWADNPTPASLFESVTGLDAHAEATFNQGAYQAVLEGICAAFERGVDETFAGAVEAELRKVA